MTNLSEKQEQVYRLLLMPIDCDKKYVRIECKDGRIHSGQRYNSPYADPDMSDFAVGFYEILYSELLDCGSILNEDCFFTNTDFAGDTMNSFQSIANATWGAGSCAKERTPSEKWPAFLQKYYEQYRCLANFWLIPMKLGRQSMKLSRYDSVDLFLSRLSDDYAGRLGDYDAYFAKIPNFEKFCEAHFIISYRDEASVLKMYGSHKKEYGEQLVANALEDIMGRAYRIAVSPFSCKLYDYFYRLRILE